MTIRTAVSAIAALALAGAPAAAIAKNEPAKVPPVYRAVVECKALADPAARLGCYDGAVSAMDSAQRSSDLVVTDRAAIREAGRGLFGLSLPKIRLLGGGEDEIKEIDGKLAAVRTSNDGMAVFVLEDGARWKQTDGPPSYAKAGDPIRVHRTGMGGFMANIKGAAGVRVVRLAN